MDGDVGGVSWVLDALAWLGSWCWGPLVSASSFRESLTRGACLPESVALRLRGGAGPCARWLDVFHNGTWGVVCSNALKDASLSILCQQLGCGEQGWLENRPGHSSLGTSWVDNIQCRRLQNSTLWQCPSAPWHPHSCTRGEEVWITCAGSSGTMTQDSREALDCSLMGSCPEEVELRMRGGEARCSGRVELWLAGSWGTVCDESWDLVDTEVVCRQLGCGRAVGALAGAAFGPGSGLVWLDEVGCRGSEASLWGCPAESWGRGDCGHKEDAGVRCAGDREAVTLRSASGSPLVLAPALEAGTLPMTLGLALGPLLLIISLVLGARWFRARGACRASGMLGSLPSEGVYEDIGAALAGAAVPEEEYDDAAEPEPEEGGAEEGAPLSPTAVQLCAVASMVLFLLYCFFARGSAPAHPYI